MSDLNTMNARPVSGYSDRIRELRRNKGFSSAESLRAALDPLVTKGGVHKWEKEESWPTKQNLTKLAKLLRTTEEYLLYGVSSNASITKALQVPVIPLKNMDKFRLGEFESVSSTWISKSDSQRIVVVQTPQIDDDSMQSNTADNSISIGHNALVDKTATINNDKINYNDFVLLRLSDGRHFIRQIIIDVDSTFLLANNAKYKRFELKPEMMVIGRLTKAVVDFG